MEYDVVETSDLEELEELRAPLRAKSGRDFYLSRKRLKLSSPVTDDLLLSTPVKNRKFGSQSPGLSLFTLQNSSSFVQTRNSSYATEPRFSSSPITTHSILSSPLTAITDLTPRHPEPSSHDDPEQIASRNQPEQSRQSAVMGLDTNNIQRYPLRMRQPVQLAPYSHDKINYKLALRNNPDAIVTVRSPERKRHGPLDEYENDGTQNESQDAESAMIHMGNRHRSRSLDARNRRGTPGLDHEMSPIGYPEILQDLPTTDEDEDEERRALSREARKILRDRKAREAKEYSATLIARSFPLAGVPKRKRRGGSCDLDVSSDQVILQPPVQPLVESDDEVDQHDPLERVVATAGSGSDSETQILDKKRLKALNHMMPRFMVRRLTESSKHPQQKRQPLTTITSGTESDDPLLPGQTRKSFRTSYAQEIRGDSESSDDGKHSDHETFSDVEIISLSPSSFGTQQGEINRGVITLSDTENDTERSLDKSSDEDIADDTIQAYLDDDDDPRNDVREVNLIDWMLSRTRTIGTGMNYNKHRSTTRNRIPQKRKIALDIVTHRGRKHGKGRQTLLNFDNHIGVLRQYENGGFRPVPTENDDSPPNVFQVMTQAAKKHDRKEKVKRRSHRRINGLYVFSGEGNTRIVSGRNELQPVTSDVNINPRGSSSSNDWADVFQPPQSAAHDPKLDIQRLRRSNSHSHAKKRRDNVAAADAMDDEVISQPQKVSIHMGIRLLRPGLSFSEETYIRKGRLDQLLGILSMTTRASEPSPCSMQGYNLHSDMGCDSFLMMLQDICEDILEFSTGLPETDHAEHLREWNIITRVVCQSLSWYHEMSSDEGRKRLQQTVEGHASTIVNRVRELDLANKSLDLAILQLDWFVVELLARAGCKPSFAASNAAVSDKALSLLVDHLVELDVHASVDAAKHDKPLNSSTVSQQSAELWVCLIHLLGSFPSAQRGTKPIWSLITTSLQKREEQSGLKASERIWETIFCLNALSQFSVYGVVTSQPKLPACWALVSFAMSKIRLTVDHVLDQEQPAEALIQRDKYINVIAFRCFHLCDKWQWQLDDASELFNALGEVFRTRKFANLRHEKSDFPQFVLNNDWSLLSKCTKTDSTFALFLKLIVKVANANGATPELSPKLKKFLSLAIPVGSLPFTKATPPSKEDLSMLFNRFSALAVGIYLDPASYKMRLSHARTYVAFANADITTRMTVIRGMMNLAGLTRKIKLPLDAMAEWIAVISLALANELKAVPTPLGEQGEEQHSQPATRYHLHICIQMLLNSIRRILDLQKQDHEYPEHMLISSLKSLFLNSRIANEPKTVYEMRWLTVALLEARSSALPHPERPHTIVDVNTESQDEYNAYFDSDFNDPNLIAVLGVADELSTHKIRDENLYKAVIETNLFWLCWRNLTKFIQELNEKSLTGARVRLLDSHIYCWIGFGDVLVRNDNSKSWSMILGQRSNWTIKNAALQRRVDLGVAIQLLKLHPMIYSTHVDIFLEVFLESLAVEDRSIEHEYASLLLSIDGLRHPLLQGLTCVKKPDHGDYNISISDYSSLRLPILRAILNNLNSALEREMSSSAADLALENQALVGYCIRGFSAMRSICSNLAEGSQAHKSYIHWCSQVFEFMQGLDYVRSHGRLTYWISWGRSLHMVP